MRKNNFRKYLILILTILKKILGVIFLFSCLISLLIFIGSELLGIPENIISDIMSYFTGWGKSSKMWLVVLVGWGLLMFLIDFLSTSISSLKYKNKKNGKKRAKWREKVSISFKK